MIVKIKPFLVSVYPQEKYAHYLMVADVRVNVPDRGVMVTYCLLDEGHQVAYNTGTLNLTQEEIAGWTETDEQLLQIIFEKLNLSPEIENN